MNALVGEVTPTHDHDQPDAVRREDGSWFVDGGMVLDRFRHLTGAGLRFPDEDSGAYHTLAGFLLYQLGVIPRAGDRLDWDGWRFEVADMDGNRIDRLLVAPAEPPAKGLAP
jgi:putative hemolysin